MIVVSDTSPIRALAHLGRVDLLHSLFGEVLVPPAVEFELQMPPPARAVVDLTAWNFIRVESPRDVSRVQQFRRSLDAGESEALALALERSAAILLMDEAKGRAAATGLGLTVVGTLGALVRAKAAGLVPRVRPLMDSLEDELGFFVSAKLRAEVLAAANE
jgi:uncharacterized protein